jgi:tRNA pseudouridine55 synthase
MDGLLIIDKPAGPTSHDIVARMRRTLREKRIGHTGTLDPAATGVLLLVLGKATRLARFLSASDKAYEAVVRFGFATDTADAQGQPIGAVWKGLPPSREAIERALDDFRGTYLQQPPAFSAKKIEGKRSHKLARARARAAADARKADARLKPSRYNDVSTNLPDPSDPSDLPGLPDPPDPSDPPDLVALPAPTTVTVHRLEIVSLEAEYVTLRVDCSAGFYVRSLAHDLGERLEVGAHIASLRRTRTGDFTIEQAMDFDTAGRDPDGTAAAIVPLADMLPRMASVTLTADGVLRALHGREIRPADALRTKDLGGPGTKDQGPGTTFVRLLDQGGALIGVATPATTPGALHPSVVLV